MTGGLVRIGRRDQRGMTTAEYAVGTVAAVTGVGALITIFTNSDFRELLWLIIKAILKWVLGSVGISF